MATYDQRSTGTDLVSHVLLMVPSSVAPPAGTSGPRDFATTPGRMSSAPHSTADAGPGPATRRPAPGARRPAPTDGEPRAVARAASGTASRSPYPGRGSRTAPTWWVHA